MPFIIGGTEATVTASIGCALAEPDATPAALLRDADTAMYRAKHSGRNAVTPFTHEMREITVRRVEVETGLRPALERRELALHYQPLHRIDGTILGFEALARWPLPGRGMVSPAEFIPIAESSGLIGALTDWAINQGLEDLAGWRRVHPELDLTLSVNITASQMTTDDLRTTIDAALARHQLPPSALCIEMTEGALVTDDPRNIDFLTALRNQGIRLSIDDFGTGYSSLSYLKIDRSFITGLPTTNGNVAVVASVVGLAHQLGMQALAEGVETADELSTLRRLGCDLVQGYLLARPMPAEEIERYLEGLLVAA
jgi:EAL domain-containing protein (putative c-di-GMP-specific phosphodiesterase class I)